MKTFAIVLLCALAAVQGRHTALQSTRTAAALGENPWFVHLRIAVATSGLLNTGAGTLIDNRWVLTSAKNVEESRFIWLRYGVTAVFNPTTVTEASITRIHPGYNAATGENNIALVDINRVVHSNDFIAPISPVGEPFFSLAKFCNFGENDDGTPGEQLYCYEVGVSQKEDDFLVISNDQLSAKYDSGAALVSDGAQVGLLVETGPGSGIFLKTSRYTQWIEEETGLNLSPEAPEAVSFIQ